MTKLWLPIETAPTDGTLVRVYVAGCCGLPSFETNAAYHPDGGWCCDELRETIAWLPIAEGGGR